MKTVKVFSFQLEPVVETPGHSQGLHFQEEAAESAVQTPGRH